MKHEPHNPDYRLISTTIFDGVRFIELVYGISNEGTNEGLEAYYKREKDGHFYRSNRWLTDAIPVKFQTYFESLQSRHSLCKDGYKLEVKLLNE